MRRPSQERKDSAEAAAENVISGDDDASGGGEVRVLDPTNEKRALVINLWAFVFLSMYCTEILPYQRGPPTPGGEGTLSAACTALPCMATPHTFAGASYRCAIAVQPSREVSRL